MDEETKINEIIGKVDDILSLIEGNKYEKYLTLHLITIKSEFERQLSQLTNTNFYTKIKE